MTAYAATTNFGSKDALASGAPLKALRGTELTTEFTNIATSVNSKLNSAPYARTTAEIAAGVTPTNLDYAPGNILRYGADPIGSIDSTAAFVAAGSTGMLIYCPTGNYRVTDNITITGGGLVGDGAYSTQIVSSSTNSNNIFNYTGANAGRFENFQLLMLGGYSSKSGGYGIAVGPASGEVFAMRYWQLVFNNVPNGINSFRASAWSISACNFYNMTGIGINIDNQNNGVSGDSAIQSCLFQCPLGPGSSIGINQVSSGGIKMVDNKFNNLNYGYLMSLGNIVGSAFNASSDTILTGNSIEGCVTAGIALFRQGGATSVFANVNIGDNQFFVQSASGIAIYSSDPSGFLRNVVIAGNVIDIDSTATAGIAINLNYITNFLVADNVIRAAVAGTTFGIIAGTSSVGGRVSNNQIKGCNTSVNATTGVNLTAGDLQTGTTSVTTSTALGALFSGTGTITFPTTFCAATAVNLGDCNVYITTAGGGGGIAAYPISVSQTQLFFGVSGATNGGSVPVRWSVKGVL